jgi:GNAT superfamily N-acetyltransferase
MRIRKLTSRTAALAAPLVEAQYRDHGIAMGGARLRSALRLLLPRHGAVLIAVDGGAAVGVAVLAYIVSLEHGGRAAWLDELYVVPERRGHGVGRSLLSEAIATARRARCMTVELEVIRGHDRAARLYLREDFRRLPRTRFSRALN